MRKLVRTLIVIAGAALVVAAIRQELGKPREQRDWYGRLGGLIPYEFRPPTPARIKATFWNPSDERVMTDTAFGVGWGVNLAEVRHRLSKRSNGASAEV